MLGSGMNQYRLWSSCKRITHPIAANTTSAHITKDSTIVAGCAGCAPAGEDSGPIPSSCIGTDLTRCPSPFVFCGSSSPWGSERASGVQNHPHTVVWPQGATRRVLTRMLHVHWQSAINWSIQCTSCSRHENAALSTSIAESKHVIGNYLWYCTCRRQSSCHAQACWRWLGYPVHQTVSQSYPWLMSQEWTHFGPAHWGQRAGGRSFQGCLELSTARIR